MRKEYVRKIEEEEEEEEATVAVETTDVQPEEVDPLADFSPFDESVNARHDKEEDIDDEEKDEIEQLREQVRATATKADINDFLATEEGSYFVKYKDKIMQVAAHPRAAGMKPEAVVALALGTKNILKVGKEIALEQVKARRSETLTGSASRPTAPTGKKDISTATNEEIIKLAQKLQRRI